MPNRLELRTGQLSLSPPNDSTVSNPWTNPVAIARSTGAIAVIIGVLVLIGWTTGVPELRALALGLGNRAAMNPMNAVSFAALGSAIWLLTRNEHWRGRDRPRAAR